MLTSIGREHLEFFGDIEGVIEEEGSLAEALPPEGCLFVNGDIEGLEEIRRRCCATVVTVGEREACDWRFLAAVVDYASFALTMAVFAYRRNRDPTRLRSQPSVGLALLVLLLPPVGFPWFMSNVAFAREGERKKKEGVRFLKRGNSTSIFI